MGESSLNDKQKTILLVDDEALIAMSEKTELEKYGYRVATAFSGEEAIEKARGNDDIDLILMDIDLGRGIDGTIAAQEILKERDIPVVFLSSHTEPEIVGKTEKITSFGYVVKDSGITVLDASIKMAFKLFESRKSLYGANEALRHHSQLLENIIENFPGFVLWKNPDSVFLGCNTNFAKKCGFSSPSEIIGKCDHDLPFFREEVETFLADDRMVMDTGLPKMHFEEREHVAHGEEIFLDTCKIPLYDADGKVSGILAVAMDITGRKRTGDEIRLANENLRQREKSLTILNEIISLANSAEDYISLFKNILEGSIGLLDYDAGGIYIVDPDGGTARMVHSQNLPQEFISETGTVPTGKPPYDTIFIKGISIITDHYERISPERASSTGICSLVSVPIFLRDRIIGALNLASKRRYVVSENEKNTIAAIGLELGSLIKRMESEEESKRAVRNIETLFNSIDEMVFILDMDGRIMQVNDAVSRLLLYDKDELAGRDVLSLHVPERRDEASRIVREMISGETDSCPVPVLAKDGKRIEVETKVTRGWWNDREVLIGVTRDVTERRRMEDALRESESKYRMLFEQAADGIAIMSIDGKSLSVNESFARMHGYEKPEELERLRLSDLDTPATVGLAPGRLSRMMDGETLNFEVEHYHRDGHIFPLSVSCRVMDIGGSKFYIGFHQDITGRRRAEELISQQLKEKEVLLKEVHHRIKNNIASIGAMLRLQAGSTDNGEAREILQEAVSRVESIRVIYEKLLLTDDYSSASVKDYLEELISAIISIFPEKNKISVRKKIDDFDMSVRTLFNIGTIINELLVNSMKYAFSGRNSGSIYIALIKKENEITISVGDDGLGLPEKYDIEKSAGFGFTLVRMLAKQLGAAFTIENDGGTKIAIKFKI